jgi:hypothetical protein
MTRKLVLLRGFALLSGYVWGGVAKIVGQLKYPTLATTQNDYYKHR